MIRATPKQYRHRLTRDQARVLLRLRSMDKRTGRYWLPLDVFPTEPELRRAVAELLRVGILLPGSGGGVAVTDQALHLAADTEGLRCQWCGDVVGDEPQCSMCGRDHQPF